MVRSRHNNCVDQTMDAGGKRRVTKFSQKGVESELQRLSMFDDPKFELEQYFTPPNIAAQILNRVNMEIDLRGKSVLDLGCGSGVLGLGAKCFGADRVLGVDIDGKALRVARNNLDSMALDGDTVKYLELDIKNMTKEDLPENWKEFDVVISNPPFGTRNCHIDHIFFKKGLLFADIVYSVHKSSTRKFWEAQAKEMQVDMELIMPRLHFPIQRTFKFHKYDMRPTVVDVIKFSRFL